MNNSQECLRSRQRTQTQQNLQQQQQPKQNKKEAASTRNFAARHSLRVYNIQVHQEEKKERHGKMAF